MCALIIVIHCYKIVCLRRQNPLEGQGALSAHDSPPFPSFPLLWRGARRAGWSGFHVSSTINASFVCRNCLNTIYRIFKIIRMGGACTNFLCSAHDSPPLEGCPQGGVVGVPRLHDRWSSSRHCERSEAIQNKCKMDAWDKWDNWDACGLRM